MSSYFTNHNKTVNLSLPKMNDPEKYESNKSFNGRDAEIFVPQLIKDMNWDHYGERIMDYGCGSGSTGFNHILPQVYLHDSHLYSIDVSEDMISYSSMRYPHANVSYAIGDIMHDNFPFKYIKFDKIFCIYVLQFIKDYREALKRFYEALAPGGILGFTMVTNSYIFLLHQELGQTDKWGKYMQDYKDYIPDVFEHNDDPEQTFRTGLKSVGFDIVKIRKHDLDWNFERFDTALEFYLAISPFTKSIPSELHEDLKDDCKQIICKAFELNPDSESYEMQYESLYVVVQKPGTEIKIKDVKNKMRMRNRLSLP